MLLHDSFFYTSNRSMNETHYSPVTIVHSPLFDSTLTLIISIFGTCSNFICMVYLWSIISQYKKRKLKENRLELQKSGHILSHEKYRFLIILTSNDFLLCLSSIISCLDEKYYFQSLVASYHLCSFHILIWKFTLHFTPLLTIFILFRYYYILNKKFPSKHFNTTTFDQLLCTDLCTLIPFVIALAWSVDGLWLWGETNMKNFIIPTIINNEQNQTNEMLSNSSINSGLAESNTRPEDYYNDNVYVSEQKIICYLQTNNNFNLTTRLLHLIQADFVLLFSLHIIGFCLEIVLHIRLSCCLIARKLVSSFIREQQLSLYILYIFACLTLTSLPFYFYRTIEIFFDLPVSFNQYDIINSRTLAQIILFGVSFKPILYLILLSPSKILLKFKCYTSIRIETIDRIDDVLLINQLNQEQNHHRQRSEHSRYSLKLPSVYPKIHLKLRTLSHPTVVISNHRSIIVDQNHNTSEVAHV